METPGCKRKLIKMNSDDQLSPDSLEAKQKLKKKVNYNLF